RTLRRHLVRKAGGALGSRGASAPCLLRSSAIHGRQSVSTPQRAGGVSPLSSAIFCDPRSSKCQHPPASGGRQPPVFRDLLRSAVVKVSALPSERGASAPWLLRSPSIPAT